MVYVDNFKAGFGRMIMCHMIADTREELLEMADKIGVARKWIQAFNTEHEHFDICIKKRKLAVQFGAKEINMRELAKMILERKIDTNYLSQNSQKMQTQVMSTQQPPLLPQQNEQMKFGRNWNNKINCHFFTTIRLDTGKWLVGKIYDVITPNGLAFRGIIREKKSVLLSQIPAITIALDLGLHELEGKKLLTEIYVNEVKDWTTQKVCVLLVENPDYWTDNEIYDRPQVWKKN